MAYGMRDKLRLLTRPKFIYDLVIAARVKLVTVCKPRAWQNYNMLFNPVVCGIDCLFPQLL